MDFERQFSQQVVHFKNARNLMSLVMRHIRAILKLGAWDCLSRAQHLRKAALATPAAAEAVGNVGKLSILVREGLASSHDEIAE